MYRFKIKSFLCCCFFFEFFVIFGVESTKYGCIQSLYLSFNYCIYTLPFLAILFFSVGFFFESVSCMCVFILFSFAWLLNEKSWHTFPVNQKKCAFFWTFGNGNLSSSLFMYFLFLLPFAPLQFGLSLLSADSVNRDGVNQKIIILNTIINVWKCHNFALS